MPNPVLMPNQFLIIANNYKTQNISLNDLKKQFNVSGTTIKKWLKNIGISEKSKSVVLSMKMKGKTSPRKGKTHKPETIELLRQLSKNRMPTTLGFKFSEESKEKMSKAAINRIKTTDSLKKMQDGRKNNMLSLEEKIARNKVRYACKRMVYRILKMARVKKDGRRSELILGYTKQDLRLHLESQFKDGMSWDKRESFHIDHIKPVAQFFREGIYDPALINALSNLQVLTPQENRLKSDKY